MTNAPTILRVLASGLLAVAVAGCATQDSLGPPPLASPSFNVGSGAADCPEEVPAEDCVELTQSERQGLWWDIEHGVQWWNEDCVQLGEYMQDFALTGDMRKWPDSLFPDWLGLWQVMEDQHHQISINDVLYGQGWESERILTLIHEAYHSMHSSDDEYAAESWAQTCVNN